MAAGNGLKPKSGLSGSPPPESREASPAGPGEREPIISVSADSPSVDSSDPDEEHRDFLRRMDIIENGPDTTYFRLLNATGLELLDPDQLNNKQLISKLWQVIYRLAELRIYLSSTDHLSDRELYSWFWNVMFHQPVPDVPFDPYSCWHLDVPGGCSEEDLYLRHKYYDTEEDRLHWKEQFPDEELPDHEDPPFDRDRYLPVAVYHPCRRERKGSAP